MILFLKSANKIGKQNGVFPCNINYIDEEFWHLEVLSTVCCLSDIYSECCIVLNKSVNRAKAANLKCCSYIYVYVDRMVLINLATGKCRHHLILLMNQTTGNYHRKLH